MNKALMPLDALSKVSLNFPLPAIHTHRRPIHHGRSKAGEPLLTGKPNDEKISLRIALAADEKEISRAIDLNPVGVGVDFAGR